MDRDNSQRLRNAARPSMPAAAVISGVPSSVDGDSPRGPRSAAYRRRELPIYAKIGIVVAGVTLLALLAWIAFFRSAGLIDGGKYQALFLTNGEVYFGKLHDNGLEYMTLEDVYYVQAQSIQDKALATDDVQNAAGVAQSKAQLIKLGSEVHGPTDKIIVRKDQVLYFENLKSDGQVAKLIEQDKEN